MYAEIKFLSLQDHSIMKQNIVFILVKIILLNSNLMKLVPCDKLMKKIPA